MDGKRSNVLIEWGDSLKANEKRLADTLEIFSKFGETPNGGVSRLSLSESDIAGRNKLVSLEKALGMNTCWDDLGNIYGRLPGRQDDVLPIVIGSHADSVEKGGNYDGILGVLGGIEAVSMLRDNEVLLKHPLILVDFTNEEGVRFEPAMFSSGVLAGIYSTENSFKTVDRNGVSFKEAIEKSGYHGERENRLKAGAAYIEYHIEQGPKLENHHKQIGIVEGIVGMVCYKVTIVGKSDHAGTTPMKQRTDPLFCGADFITDIKMKLMDLDNELVFTIGEFSVDPDLHTVIPAKIEFSLDMRHRSAQVLEKAKAIVKRELVKACENFGCKSRIVAAWERNTTNFDTRVISAVSASADESNFSSYRLFSGAGHDAQFISTMMPTSMIFVPSIGGKSHCEEEKTTYEDCANGAEVLANAIVKLDTKL